METLKNFLIGLFAVALLFMLLVLGAIFWPLILGIGSLLIFFLVLILSLILIFYMIVLLGYIVRKGLKQPRQGKE
ncbi:MAG: hypothetical protein NG740_07265 [Omnitrophica bacterium]|nr:hypothetical protein [Candidatus Omnitrophota bacterium]